MNPLLEQFGPIDIYLFDQLLRGRITPGMRILDGGCGGGRNLLYLLREGYEVCAVDPDPGAVDEVKRLASQLAPWLPTTSFRAEALEDMSFEDGCFDAVLLNAVLHFARNDDHFRAMVQGAWRVLKPGGVLFARLASTIGMDRLPLHPLGDRRFLLPDGSERYLVDESLLLRLTSELGGEQLDPLKTTVVQNQRAMTTWVLRKS